MKQYETVIGLEVHVELATKTKIFCGCSTEFGGAPNTHTCPVCTGMPGSLPVLNKKVVEFALKAGLAANCQIHQYCKFDRKNYFYPDNPQNYQISQLYLPICHDGWVEIETSAGKKKIRIHEMHMEEDAGKLIHDEWEDCSLVDYNRSGVPLIEIVSEPDMRSSEEVIAYLEKLRCMMQYLDVSEDDRIVVAQLFGKRNLQTVDEKVEYIQKIVSYLKDNYTYTLKPGRVPEGKSVVEYFLRESKRGYCTYFATSAAVILRCAGIPARYCAGYTVNTNTGAYYTDGQSNKYMKYDVYDNAAHAWVEAYIDGYGWVIVDATPGYGEVEDTEQSSTQDESERQSQSDNSNSSVDENMTVDDTDEPGTESTAQEAVSDTDSFSGEIHINSVLIVVCTAILAVLILIAMAAIRIVSRIHLLRSSSVDEVKLMKIYSYLEKLLACLGYKREPGIDYEEYILEITAQDANLKNMGLEKAVQTILAVRFGNVKCVDKADITGIINTIRQVRSYALKKARGLKKLVVCLI